MRFFVFLFFLLSSSLAFAEAPIGLVTGPKTGTYFAVGCDISKVAKQAGISIAIKSSEGSIDNIKRINSTENAALGIVQSDVLSFLVRSKNPDSKRAAENLRVVFPLYNEEVHVLANRKITDVSELAGKKVIIGEENSGHMMTAINLLSILGIEAETDNMSPEKGVVAVLRGQADAVIVVGGKPMRLFKNLEDLAAPENQKYATMLDGVHFLKLNDSKLQAEYKTATLSKLDYAFMEEDVPTIAVNALLVSYDFAQMRSKKNCDTLSTLSKSIRAALPSLKEKGHIKWKEVDLDYALANIPKDQCAWK